MLGSGNKLFQLALILALLLVQHLAVRVVVRLGLLDQTLDLCQNQTAMP